MARALDLAGVAEVAALLGVSRQRVSQLRRTAGFPEPVAVLAAGPVWRRTDIDAWYGVHRAGSPRPGA